MSAAPISNAHLRSLRRKGDGSRREPVIPDVLEKTGVTYRQLDYWIRRGYLKPAYATSGTGNYRQWPAKEVAVCRLMARLVKAGLKPEAAHRVARLMDDDDGNVAPLASGVFIVLTNTGETQPSEEKDDHR